MKAQVKGEDKLYAVVGKAGYTAFSRVSALTFFEDPRSPRSTYSLLLALETDRSTNNYRLHMKFTAVRELNIRGFGGSPTQITGFAIVDISDRQLEGVKLEAFDYEHNDIRFLCQAAEIESVEPVKD